MATLERGKRREDLLKAQLLDAPEGVLALRSSPVAPAQVSNAAQRKYQIERSAEGFPLHSMSTLLADLATLYMNRIALANKPDQQFLGATQATPHLRPARCEPKQHVSRSCTALK